MTAIILANICFFNSGLVQLGRGEMGRGHGAICPWASAQGLGDLIFEHFEHFECRKCYEMHLSQHKGCDQKLFYSLCLQGASFRSFVPEPPKPLGCSDLQIKFRPVFKGVLRGLY